MSSDARHSREIWVDPRTWRVEARFGRAASTGSVLRIGPNRIEAVFTPSESLPPIGRSGELVISGGELDAPILRNAMAADRVDVAPDLLMFGFDVAPGSPGVDQRSLGERRAVRIPVPDERPVRAVIRCAAGETTGRVRDLSIAGLSLVCPASAESQLAGASRVEVRFVDTATFGERPISARIQHRRSDEDATVVYGIAFAGGELSHLEQVIARLQRTHVRMR